MDETASKIIVQYNPKDRRFNGFSVMPRFVIIRNVSKDFDVKSHFDGLDTRRKKIGQNLPLPGYLEKR